jgi:sialate O-acetylesterase
MRVNFATLASPLVLRGETTAAFEIAGSDRVFHPASARIEGETLLVASASVKEPFAVRYAWANAPVAALFNAEGLPAAQFRSDHWR